MSKLKRRTIGVLINQLEGGFQGQLWPGIVDAANNKDINLILYCGKIPKLEYKDFYQHEIAFHLVDKSCVDGLVSLTVALGYAYEHGFDEFMERYREYPIVSLCRPLKFGPKITFDGSSGSYDSIVHLIQEHNKRKIAYIRGPKNHFDAEEHFKGYQQALKDHHIPFEEKRVVREEFMDTNGGERAAKQLIDSGVEFDAIVGCNDEISIGALNVLVENGFDVPKDIAVIGHDNILESTFCLPQLTTVNQPTREMGATSVDVICKILDGEKVKDIILNTELVIRNSCGCYTEIISGIKQLYLNQQKDKNICNLTNIENQLTETTIRPKDKKLLIKLLKKIIDDPLYHKPYDFLGFEIDRFVSKDLLNLSDIIVLHRVLSMTRTAIDTKKLNLENHAVIERRFQVIRTALTLAAQSIQGKNMHHMACSLFKMRDASADILSAVSHEELIDKLKVEIRNLEVDECYICLYEKPFVHHIDDPWQVPKTSYLLFAARNFEFIDLKGRERHFRTQELIPKWLREEEEKEAYTWAVSPLFVRNKHHGYIIQSMKHCVPSSDDHKYEGLRDIVSTATENAYLYQKITDYQEQLERSNARLQDKVVTDDLTGLYNRHGFMSLAPVKINKSQMNNEMMALIFADMDGLKAINDTYGHAEGDNAIITMAECMRSSFRDVDFMARLAGDEFVILMSHVKDENTVKNMICRLDSCIDASNEQHQKCYQISTSTGYVIYHPSKEQKTLDELMAKADAKLYEQKRQRKNIRRI